MSDTLAQATTTVNDAQAQLRDQLAALAQAEGRYLMQEYRVYLPSGNFVLNSLLTI